jgi:hypothetical protein
VKVTATSSTTLRSVKSENHGSHFSILPLDLPTLSGGASDEVDDDAIPRCRRRSGDDLVNELMRRNAEKIQHVPAAASNKRTTTRRSEVDVTRGGHGCGGPQPWQPSRGEIFR